MNSAKPLMIRILSVLTLAACVLSVQVNADASRIAVDDRGEGPVLVFLPGLNSNSETFAGTCEAFLVSHRCLLLSLPGFAGTAPMEVQDGFLVPLRDATIALLREKQITNATLVGHSLGGNLAMMIALAAPELAARLVLIDSLPYYAAIQNPALTADIMQPQVEMMRRQMNMQTDEAFFQAAAQNMNSMTRDAARQSLLVEWALASDRATTTAAMLDMLMTDLRSDIAAVMKPMLVLGSWAAYADFGSTLESTREVFAAQYAAAPHVDIHMSEAGYHFLAWDDGEWVNTQIRRFIDK